MKNERIDKIKSEHLADKHTFDQDLDEARERRAQMQINAELFLEGAKHRFPGAPINNQWRQ